MGSKLKSIKFLLIVSFAFGMIMPVYSLDNPQDWPGCIKFSAASLKQISCPKGRWIDDFYLSQDGSEAIILLTTELKELYIYKTTGFFSLDEYLAGGRFERKNLSLEEAERIYQSWREEGSKGDGAIFNKYQEYFKPYAKKGYSPADDFGCHFEKKEFWKYNLSQDRWIKLEWKEGLKIFAARKNASFERSKIMPGNSLSAAKDCLLDGNRRITPVFVYGIEQEGPVFSVSPDANKLVYRPFLKKGKISNYRKFLRKLNGMKERQDFFVQGLAVCCVATGENKVFETFPDNLKINLEKCRWSTDSSLMAFPQSRFENAESPDLLIVLSF